MRSGSLLLGLCLAASGCVGDLIELTPGGASRDGGGDQAMVVNTMPKFFPDIQADIDVLGCPNVACHGGTQVPNLKPMPVTQADKDANYNGVKMRAMNGAMSLVLLKLLNDPSVMGHTGGMLFTGKTDPKYVKWLTWINNGNPEQ
jgi:hypothetical protein